jgi:MFS family permease
MADQTYQRRILPNNSLLPRGFGLRYIWTRLRVYLLLIVFLATGFGAVAAAMADFYGWAVLFTACWLMIASGPLLAYKLIVTKNAQLTKPSALPSTEPIVVDGEIGEKLESIPFSGYHTLIISVLALVGFVEGYNLVITGSLLVLAKTPLHLTEADIRLLAVGPTLMLSVGSLVFSEISDHWSRKTVMLIGVVATTFLTLLIPVVQNAEQLIIVRLLTGFGAGGAVSAAFPIAAELIPARHRRTYGAMYEMALACAFTLAPFIAFLLTDNPHGFRFLALLGGLALFVAPVLVYIVIPESPRWHLSKGQPRAAVDLVNLIIRLAGNRVAPLTTAAPRNDAPTGRERFPPFWALFRRDQLLWTAVGTLSVFCAGTAYFLIAVLLPKALVDQGATVSLSFGLTTLMFLASLPGRAFTGFLMETVGRRWTIAWALGSSLLGLFLMLMGHRVGQNAILVSGALIIGFTVLSASTVTRVYLSEQFPTSLRRNGQVFGESFRLLFAGVLAPFLMAPYTGSPTVFFGTISVVVAFGAFIPLLFARGSVSDARTGTADSSVQITY